MEKIMSVVPQPDQNSNCDSGLLSLMGVLIIPWRITLAKILFSNWKDVNVVVVEIYGIFFTGMFVFGLQTFDKFLQIIDLL